MGNEVNTEQPAEDEASHALEETSTQTEGGEGETDTANEDDFSRVGDDDTELDEESDEPDFSAADKPNGPLPDQTARAKANINIKPVAASLDDYLNVDELPSTEEVLASIKPRPAHEVLENDDIKLAVSAVLDSGNVTDYRPRVIIPIRYGAYPQKFARMPIAARRGSEAIPLARIMESIPSYRGASLNSASQILGLSRPAILKTEISFLRASKTAYPALTPLIATLEDQLKTLERA